MGTQLSRRGRSRWLLPAIGSASGVRMVAMILLPLDSIWWLMGVVNQWGRDVDMIGIVALFVNTVYLIACVALLVAPTRAVWFAAAGLAARLVGVILWDGALSDDITFDADLPAPVLGLNEPLWVLRDLVLPYTLLIWVLIASSRREQGAFLTTRAWRLLCALCLLGLAATAFLSIAEHSVPALWRAVSNGALPSERLLLRLLRPATIAIGSVLIWLRVGMTRVVVGVLITVIAESVWISSASFANWTHFWRLGSIQVLASEILKAANHSIVLAIVAWYCIRAGTLSKFDKPHCWRCGYNMTGNVSGYCPECGAPGADADGLLGRHASSPTARP